MGRDIRDAVRALRGAPVYTAVALVVLALGIGASTAIFSVVDAVILRGLPFDEHDRLVAIGERNAARPAPGTGMQSVAPQNYLDWKAQQQVFESVTAVTGTTHILRDGVGEPEEVRAQRVDADFFTVLRQQPLRGRAFTADETVEGRHRVAIISHGLWQRRFGADPAAVGSSLPGEDGSYEIIGVMPPGFSYPVGSARPTELWVPLVIPANEVTRDPRRRSYYLSVIARLRDGVSAEQARAQMDQISIALEQAHPEWNKDWRTGLLPLQEQLVGENMRKWMWMLLGAVGMVLLIACANVANLMLARATTRERELGIRAALGAGRARLMRQLLVESLVLALAGTALGVVLAWWGVQLLRTSMPDGVPRVASIALDLRVLGVAALTSLVTGLAFGLFPALQSSRPDLTSSLKDGARGATAGFARQWLRSALVVAEVALAMVLLVGAGLFIGSFMTVMNNEPGFDMRNLLTSTVRLRVPPGTSRGVPAEFERGPVLLADVVERARRIPGVQSVAAISGGMPLSGSMSSTNISVPGRTITDDDGISIRSVTPSYHETMRIPLRAGRYISDEDRKGGVGVVLLNEAAVKKYLGGASPVGQTVNVQGDRQVIGVVGDVRQGGPESERVAEAYIPLAQGRTAGGEVVIRTEKDPYAVLPALKAAAYAAAPDVPLRNINTMEELLARRVAQRKFNMILLSLFGVLALVISAVGIYGVMAYIVAQRTHEIGVRMALGATRGSVVNMVLRKAVILVAIGLAIGATAAYFLSTAVKTFLFNIQPTDARVFAAALLALTAAALLASAIPARRAAGVDPMVALRNP